MFSKVDVGRCGDHGRPGCGRMVRWTKTEAGKWLAVDLQPDPGGNTAVRKDLHGVLRSRRVTKDQPIAPHEKLMMPHTATCPGPRKRKKEEPPPRPRPRPRAGELYERLGVDQAATQQDIKTAYRRLARELHPDKNPGDSAAAERFKGVTEAYDVLSNSERRHMYDLSGRPPRAR
ncbi:DnaJ domain-containing protein [Nonomuraea maritima]|uniref:DnaJ domain-containing protein n=1 Tax=Nonomuraea maritima TaxID=683260 RepID=A0A1G9MJK0_9ACTN|nr:J domain-containing protein [Nonomuraea maritima]SDL74263.1 DnaJ domain-containing protein [Nonomuraea maritima]